jgi:hypothetical protein
MKILVSYSSFPERGVMDFKVVGECCVFQRERERMDD